MSLPTPAQITYQKAHIQDDRRVGIAVSNGICLGVGTVAVLLRYLSRRFSRSEQGMDDWLTWAALIWYMLYTSAYQVAVHYGLGRHSILITDLKGFIVSTIITAIVYNFVIVTTKISILFFYRRLFPQTWFKNCLYATGIVLIMSLLGQVPIDIFQCVPIRSGWSPNVKGTCINFGAAALATGIINVLTDLILITLPIPVVWRLNTSSQRRWLLILTFTAGGLATIVSFVRLFYLREFKSYDPAWGNVNGAELSTIEIGVGILSACIPTYRPLYDRYFAKRNLSASHETQRNISNNSGAIKLSSRDRDWHSRGQQRGNDSDEEALNYGLGMDSRAHYSEPEAPESRLQGDKDIRINTQLTVSSINIY